MKKYVILLILIIPLLATLKQNVHISILFTNNGNGIIKADGNKNQPYGSLAQRKFMIDTIRDQENNVILLESGNFLPPHRNGLLAKAILKSYSLMNYCAVNIAYNELLHINELKQYSHKIHFVSSNISLKDKNLIINPYLIYRISGLRIGIFGIMYKNLYNKLPTKIKNKVIFHNPITSIKNYLDLFEGKLDYIILLSQGSQDNKLVSNIAGINLILSSYKFSKAQKIRKTQILRTVQYIKELGKIDITLKKIGRKYIQKSFKYNFIQLDNTIAEDNQLADIYYDYYYYSKVNKGYKVFLKGPKYCAKCHSKIYKKWIRDKHHNSFNTLIKGGKTYYPSCLRCHTTGYERGGFISRKRTPQLASVSCESCHVVAKNHPAPNEHIPRVTSTTCKKCHHGKCSPNFDYLYYKSRLKHK